MERWEVREKSAETAWHHSREEVLHRGQCCISAGFTMVMMRVRVRVRRMPEAELYQKR